MVQSDRVQITILRMRIACLTTKATYTHSEYVTRFAFPLQPLLTRVRLNLLAPEFYI
jgi:hypothetical protein